jgi:MoxR-like ATPase
MPNTLHSRGDRTLRTGNGWGTVNSMSTTQEDVKPSASSAPGPDDAIGHPLINTILASIEHVILGKRETIRMLLVGLISRGHVLIEDVPGVGKTMLARALARSIDSEFRRIQFTPDLLPSDIVGVSVYDQKNSKFEFHPGPIFANVILADEINRTTPRTQSSLLEAMSDYQVSVDGETRKLPHPFIVLATQNPIEYAGTYPLPEAQLDRFLMKIRIGYPDKEHEMNVLKSQRGGHPIDDLKPVVTGDQILELQREVQDITVDDSLSSYILDLAAYTRQHKNALLGVSTRGALMLYRAAQARALINGRTFVTPDDIKILADPVWSHRIIEKSGAAGPGRSRGGDLLRETLGAVPVPV